MLASVFKKRPVMILRNPAARAALLLRAHPVGDARAVDASQTGDNRGAAKAADDCGSGFKTLLHDPFVASIATMVKRPVVEIEIARGSVCRYIANVLTEWLKTALGTSGVKQAELARRMTDFLGRSIDRAAVNKMTKGERGIAADEMLAIMKTLGAPLPKQFADLLPEPDPDADRTSGPLSEDQARVVEVAIQAYWGWMAQHPAYRGVLSDPDTIAAAASVISELSRSRRFREAALADPQQALSTAQLAFDLKNER
jgi:hypothetical protein